MRIEIPDLVSPDDLERLLVERLGLKRAAVIATPTTGVLAALAAPLSTLLQEIGLRAGSVLAIGWGRAVREVVQAGLPSIPGLIVVPATGGMQQHAPHFQVNEFVRIAAEHMRGIPHFVHAPYLPSASAREAFLCDPAIADSVALWDRIDAAIVGVGLPHVQNSPEASPATPDEQALVDAAGDVIRHYVDAAGRLIQWDGEQRMIAASPEQLRRAPWIIAVAAGEDKAAAIVGAIGAGFVKCLITNVATAEAILFKSVDR